MDVPPAARLRQLIAEKDRVVAPGVFDGFSARIALDVGFDCIYMVGSSQSCQNIHSPWSQT